MKRPTLKETLVDTRTALGVLEEGGVPDYVVYVSHPTDPTPLYWRVGIALDYLPGRRLTDSEMRAAAVIDESRCIAPDLRIPDRGVSFRVKPSG